MNVLLMLLGLLFAVLCVLLVLVVLIQPSKSGGGLGGLGGGSAGGAISETLGATQSEKSLNKLTIWCVSGFFVLALLLTFLGNLKQKSKLDLQSAPPAPAAGAAPAASGVQTLTVNPDGTISGGEGITITPVTAEDAPPAEGAPAATVPAAPASGEPAPASP